MKPAPRRGSRRSRRASDEPPAVNTSRPRPASARLRVVGALLIAVGVPLLLFLGYLALPVFWRGNQALYEAIEARDLVRVEKLLQGGAAPNSRSRGFQFLRLGAHDRRRYFEEPALIRAIAMQQPEIAIALLNAGADANARSAEGQSAIELAERQGQMAVVVLLRGKGAQD
jgi:ankyrin repeat protein